MDPALAKQVALGAAPPLGAMFLTTAALWRLGRRSSAEERGWRLAALPCLMSAVYIGTHLLALGVPDWPVRRALHTLVFAALIAGAAGVILALRRWPAAVVVAIGALAAGLAAWLGVRGAMSSWDPGQTALRLGAVTAAGGLNVLAAERIVRDLAGRAGPVAVLLAVGGAAQVLATGFFSLTLGQAAGIGAATLTGAIAASFIAPGRAAWSAVPTVPVVMAVVCLFQGALFGGSERPWVLFGLCAAALPLGGAVLMFLPRAWSSVRRAACVMLGIVLPLGTAVVLGLLAWLSASQEY